MRWVLGLDAPIKWHTCVYAAQALIIGLNACGKWVLICIFIFFADTSIVLMFEISPLSNTPW